MRLYAVDIDALFLLHIGQRGERYDRTFMVWAKSKKQAVKRAFKICDADGYYGGLAGLITRIGK